MLHPSAVRHAKGQQQALQVTAQVKFPNKKSCQLKKKYLHMHGEHLCLASDIQTLESLPVLGNLCNMLIYFLCDLWEETYGEVCVKKKKEWS